MLSIKFTIESVRMYNWSHFYGVSMFIQKLHQKFDYLAELNKVRRNYIFTYYASILTSHIWSESPSTVYTRLLNVLRQSSFIRPYKMFIYIRVFIYNVVFASSTSLSTLFSNLSISHS